MKQIKITEAETSFRYRLNYEETYQSITEARDDGVYNSRLDYTVYDKMEVFRAICKEDTEITVPDIFDCGKIIIVPGAPNLKIVLIVEVWQSDSRDDFDPAKIVVEVRAPVKSLKLKTKIAKGHDMFPPVIYHRGGNIVSSNSKIFGLKPKNYSNHGTELDKKPKNNQDEIVDETLEFVPIFFAN